jgi:hypothetical protein
LLFTDQNKLQLKERELLLISRHLSYIPPVKKKTQVGENLDVLFLNESRNELRVVIVESVVDV